MIRSSKISLVFLVSVIVWFKISLVFCLNDYYWRDYFGKIPFDAVPGGLDINNEITYIGQVYIKDQGIFPSTITPGEKEIYAPIVGAKKSQGFVQILCANDVYDFFKWKVANKTHLHLQTIDDVLVKGGIEGNHMLYIGRVKYENELIVGKILGGSIGNAVMYFVNSNKEERAVDSYEVLIVENRTILDDRFEKDGSAKPSST